MYNLQGIHSQESVVYGMRSSVFTEIDNTSRIFFDKRGDLYPVMDISDEALRDNDNAIQTYFSNNQEAFSEAAKYYGLDVIDYSVVNYKALQNAILERNLNDLHARLTADNELFVLVHGFRKPLKSTPRSSSALEDNQNVKSAISSYRSDKSIHYLEVYWDGTFISIPNNLGSLIRMGKLFKKSAIPYSNQAGLGLRLFVSKIKFQKIHIIAHSLGAQVVNNCLFNANVDSSIPTPAQDQINVCLVAPAIARKPFRSFYERSIAKNYQSEDNYHYAIIYNERDIVIAKSNPNGKRKFRFTRFYGNTKLGCNCAKEAVKVAKLFGRKYPGSKVELLDASAVGGDHRWKSYATSNSFREYIQALE